MEHEQLEEAIAAFALGAIDDAPRVETERALLEHLAGCASCRELFTDLREVAADLALSAEPRAVPKAVEERLLEAIRERRPQVERPGRRRSVLTRAGALAVAAAIVGLFAWNVQLSERVSDARSRSKQVVQALSLLGSTGARTASLDAGRGDLVFVYRKGEAVLVGHDLETPPSGRVLQLWLMRSGMPTSVGVFRPSDGLVVFPVHADATGFDRVAITVEKGPRGAKAPTAAPVYSATITA